MFKFFKKDPAKRLKEEYQKLLERAMSAQRNGDIESYANLTAQANKILEKIDTLATSPEAKKIEDNNMPS